jgi:hypothetical protein
MGGQWKREDMPAVKRSLEQSVTVLNQAISLDPHDGEVRGALLKHTKRLARLPR